MHTKIIPVIHYADDAQAMRNAQQAFEADCEGVLLIHMEGRNALLTPSASAIKERWPERLVGINFLGMDPDKAVKANIAAGLDMTWTDEQVTHSDNAPWTEADRIRDAMAARPGHLMFVGVAFKHQRHEPDPRLAGRLAVNRGFIPTTSGAATGVAAEVERIAQMRRDVGQDAPLAIASGITPENAAEFAPLLTHILVATGVSSSFHEFDPERLQALRAACS